MKKVMLMAVLFCLGSTAMAVNYDWTTVCERQTSAGSTNEVLNMWADRSATIAMQVTYGSTLGTGTVFAIAKDTNNNAFSVTIDADGNYALATSSNVSNGTTAAGTAVKAEANKTQVIGLSFYRSAGDVMQTVELSVDGVVVSTISNATIEAGPMKWIEWGRAVGNQNAYTGSATYDVWATQNGGNAALLDAATIKAEVAALPEPTVLALLALGVAGIALKRKVA